MLDVSRINNPLFRGFFICNKKPGLPYSCMIVLTINETSESFVVTLNEKRTLTSGYYLFVFTNITTKAAKTKIYNFTEDNSSYPDRFNQFDINTSVVFSGADTGEWLYNVYEQASSSNTDVTGLTEVERGLLKLNAATEFEFEKYNESTSYKQYTG